MSRQLSSHLSVDELIDHLYGLRPNPHLEECAECTARAGAMELRRRESAAPEAVSSEFLAAERRKIYARLDQRPARRLHWLPALAAAGVLAVVALIYKPPAPPAVHPDPADAQLFSEVYSMEQTTEPEAAAPIHELFEDNSQ